MKLTTHKNFLVYNIFSKVFISIFASIIPVLIATFILGLLHKLEIQINTPNGQLLLIVYIFSFILVYLFSLIKEFVYQKNFYLLLDENGIEIFESFITQSKNIIPLINLQSFEVSQSFWERLLGLGTIFITTKHDEVNYEISGLEYKSASEFIEKASKKYKLKINQN